MKLNKLLKLHHFGLAVSNFKAARLFYKAIGYRISKTYYDKFQNVKIILCTSKTEPTIELISSLKGKSPIKGYLKNYNEVFYHSCYEFNDKEVPYILKKKFNAKCVLNPIKVKIFGNRKISFYYIKDVGLIELLDNVK